MNTAHWHLLLNHLPMVGSIFGGLVLIAGYILKNNSAVKQTALGVLVLSALLVIPAYLTGEGAEDVVETVPGIDKNFIETHEELGQEFLIAVISLGVLALITFLADLKKSKYAGILYGIVLIGTIGTAVVAKKVGTSGGEIRHTEIRNGGNNQSNPNAGEQSGGEQDDD